MPQQPISGATNAAPLRDADAVIHGGGTMGDLVRAKDWSVSPLGPIASWPQSLRTTVNLCLASNFPIAIAWGPGRVQIYNDGYLPICGAKHPVSLGQDFRECWASAWPVIGEAFDLAASGHPSFLENQRLFVDRRGYLEETFFTFSFSPVRDESGGIGGLFHPVIELTQQSLAERRLKVLRDVAGCTDESRSVEEALGTVARVLCQYEFDLPFALVYLVDSDGRRSRLIEAVGMRPTTSASPLLVDLDVDSGNGWPFAEAARSGQIVRVDALRSRFGALEAGPYPEAPDTAFVLPVKLSNHEHPIAIVVAGASARRPLDELYSVFYQMLGQAITNSLTRVRAHQEERMRAEALLALDRAKTTFFNNVSHEFRTPLTLILGPLEEDLRDNPRSRARLEPALRNGRRLLRLVNTLLDFSRLEAARLEPSCEAVDISALTTEIAGMFRPTVEGAGLQLIVDCPPLKAAAYVDREMWEKIVSNLLSNAFKFTFEGAITVTIRQVGERIELRVADTGIGVPAAELPRIFERFHRVRDARSRSHEGTGIGLALVHELAALHGGELFVQSEEGQGSVFTLSMPCGCAHLKQDWLRTPQAHPSGPSATRRAPGALGVVSHVEEAARWLPDATDATDAAETTETTDDGGAPRPRVLVADDNADMREYLTRILGQRYRIVSVGDGVAALAAARQEPFDLIVTDVMMPRLDGFGLLQALRQDPVLRALPVIVLSARAGEESRIEGLLAGADDYLVKPFSTRELLARVSSSVALARMRRDVEGLERLMAERTAQLEERETLLLEIHHRVKNNLAVISSLISMQVRKLSDQPSRAALLECRSRVHAMAMIHEMLYRSKNYSEVPFGQYARELATQVHEAVDTSADRVRLELELDDFLLPVDKAIPCGMILNELMTNALKHAFPDGAVGAIKVTLRDRVGGRVCLRVADNGIGRSHGRSEAERRSLGLDLIGTLVSQLDGDIVQSERSGTAVDITFPRAD